MITDSGKAVDAKVMDTSPSGLGVEAMEAVNPGGRVRLECRGVEVAEGIVQHCRPDGSRFVVGIAFRD